MTWENSPIIRERPLDGLKKKQIDKTGQISVMLAPNSLLNLLEKIFFMLQTFDYTITRWKRFQSPKKNINRKGNMMISWEKFKLIKEGGDKEENIIIKNTIY